jgi:hypothetical protein
MLAIGRIQTRSRTLRENYPAKDLGKYTNRMGG